VLLDQSQKRKGKFGYERISLIGLVGVTLRIANSIPAAAGIGSRNFADSYSVFMRFSISCPSSMHKKTGQESPIGAQPP
jgi:hypothetical protein